MRTLADWLEYIGQIHPVGWDLGLDRVSRVAERLGVCHPAKRVVLAAGTNGKGSYCEALNHLAVKAGLRVGLTTSPHIQHFSERIRIQGRRVEDEVIVDAFKQIETARAEITLTYFEFSSLAALVVFQASDLDLAILEVGLGGRLDAMNVVTPDVSVILPIAMDHEHYLGSTREAIGLEKAGILRERMPAVIADPDPPQSVLNELKRLDVPTLLLVQDFGWDGERLWWTSNANQIEAHIGEPRLPSVSLAAAMQTSAMLCWAPAPEGLTDLTLMGRQSWLQHGDRTLLMDVAHNPHAIARLGRTLRAWLNLHPTSKIEGVFGVYRDKALAEMLLALEGAVTFFHCSQVDEARALPGAEIVKTLHAQGLQSAASYPSISEALAAALGHTTSSDLVVVFGSFPVVGESLNYLGIHPFD